MKFYNPFSDPNNLYKEKIKTNWIYLLLLKPDIYLFKLILNTLVVGAISFCITCVCLKYDVHLNVPSSAHQLVGVAIGLLLVYRTQTAYERWSSASKNFNNLKDEICFLSLKISSIIKNESDEIKTQVKSNLISNISNIIYFFKMHLKSYDIQTCASLNKSYLLEIKNLFSLICKYELTLSGWSDADTKEFRTSIKNIIIKCNSCIYIKNTPIPTSYALHIKVSIFLYILSLPISLFANMGMWSAIMVMFVYYIIAGIEIISKEIENPFEGSPNDINIDKVTNDIIITFEQNL